MKRILTIIAICLALAVPITLFRNAHVNTINIERSLRSKAELKARQADEATKAKDLEIKELKKLNEQQAKELQAKAAEKQRIAALPKPTVYKPPTVVASGSCLDWIKAAGISDIANASELIRRESGCNPTAVNRSSGACGIAQELPCGKSGCALGDGACQIAWMARYVANRYGSWAAAVSFHNANGWY